MTLGPGEPRTSTHDHTAERGRGIHHGSEGLKGLLSSTPSFERKRGGISGAERSRWRVGSHHREGPSRAAHTPGQRPRTALPLSFTSGGGSRPQSGARVAKGPRALGRPSWLGPVPRVICVYKSLSSSAEHAVLLRAGTSPQTRLPHPHHV